MSSHADQIEEALEELRKTLWYPFDSGRDRVMVASSAGLDVTGEVHRWLSRHARIHPFFARAALQAWLRKSPRPAAAEQRALFDAQGKAS